MTSTVIRIKRPLSEEPAEAFVLDAKKARIEKSDSGTATSLKDESPKNVFKFFGTLKDEKADVNTILKIVKTSQATCFHQSPKTIKRIQSGKGEKTALIPSNDKKYKVLSSLRNIDETHNLKVYDLVEEDEENLPKKQPEVVTCNGIPLVVEHVNSKPYVYDFYYCEGKTIDETYVDQLMTVQRYFYEPELSESEQDDNDSSSNDEGHWKNDYPEEDDNECEDDDDLIDKMIRVGLNDNENAYLSSSDDDSHGLIYSKDDDDLLPGDAYAKYKKRVIKHLDSSFNGDEDEDEDDDGNDDDDDDID